MCECTTCQNYWVSISNYNCMHMGRVWNLYLKCNVKNKNADTPQLMQQVMFQKYWASWNFVYVWSRIPVYTRASRWNLNSNTLETDWPQYDHPAASVISQQYSSTTSALLYFIPTRMNLPHLKNVIYIFLLLLIKIL